MNTDKIIVFLATWAIVSLAVLILSAILNSQIVFGNGSVSGYISAVTWSFLFTCIGQISPGVMRRVDLKLKDERSEMITAALLLVPLIWLIKRFALFTGLGISKNLFVLLMSLLVAVVAYYSSKYSSYYLKKIQ